MPTTPAKKAPAKKAAPRKAAAPKAKNPRPAPPGDVGPVLSPSDPAMKRTIDPVVTTGRSRSISERILRWLPLGCFVLTLVIVPAAFNASSNTEAQRRSDRITGCRAEANSEVTDANTEARRAELANEVLTNRFIEVVSTRDVASLEDVLPKLEPSRRRLKAADAALDAANRNYQRAVRLSQTDPDEFLEQCAGGRFTITTKEQP